MNQISEESSFIIIQFFLIDPLSDNPKIDDNKREKNKRVLLKELETLTQEYDNLDTNIDLTDYKEGIHFLKNIKRPEDYQLFIDDLLQPYE